MMSAPSAAPGIDPMPPTMTTTSEASRKRESSPGEIDWKVPPTMPAIPGKSRAESEHRDEHELHRHAQRRQHVAVVDSGADHADPRAIEREPHRDADHDRGGEDDEPHERILKKDRLAAGFDRDDERSSTGPTS